MGLELGHWDLWHPIKPTRRLTHAQLGLPNAFCVFDKRVGDFPQLIYSYLNSQLLFPYL